MFTVEAVGNDLNNRMFIPDLDICLDRCLAEELVKNEYEQQVSREKPVYR
jgi:hypothetical protein